MKKTGTYLILAFLFSVLIRVPNLNRPLSKHHEFCTAVALRVLDIWHQEGIANSDFNPVMNYPGAANKHINNFASASGDMVDDEGNYFYVSHPPLAYYVPYFVFSVFGIAPSVLAIQVFHLLIHFLCGLGIYFLIQLILKQPVFNFSFPAFAGYLFYLFSPGTLWFQSNTYMSDMFVQLFFIWGIVGVMNFRSSRKISWLIFLALMIFCAVYTSWLGVFFAFALLFYPLLSQTEKKIRVEYMTTVVAAVTIGLGLVFFQYSNINGWEAYFGEAFGRYITRSGIGGGLAGCFGGFMTILKNYLTSYLPLFVFSIVLLFSIGSRLGKLITRRFRLFSFIAIIPVLLLHLVLTNYSGHDFVSLYGAVFLCVFAGLLYSNLNAQKRWYSGLLIALLISSVGQYYYINQPGDISLKGDRYAILKEQGEFIRDNIGANQVAFLQGAKPSPEMIYYAHRNIQQIKDESEATYFLLRHKQSKGIIFTIVNGKIQVLNKVSDL